MNPLRADATAAIADYALSRHPKMLTPEDRRAITSAFVDTVGVVLAARRGSLADIVTRAAQETGPLSPLRGATNLIAESSVPARQAAFVNAAVGHALDYDDVCFEMYGHPSVVLVPTLTAIAERSGATGRDLITSYAIGLEVDLAVAAALRVRDHYTRGWHATATVGVVGATVAAGYLMNLDAGSLRRAIGIATSMASGLRGNFGTMTKTLHVGLAASNAILAVDLAAEGFTANDKQIEGMDGYLQVFGDSSVPQVVASCLSKRWNLAKILRTKWYPCCYNTHRMIDAALFLAPQKRFDAKAIKAVRVAVEPKGLEPLSHHNPTTGNEARFSAKYVTAHALLNRSLGLSAFHDSAVAEPATRRLMSMIDVRESDLPPEGPPGWADSYAVLEVEFRDGSRLRERRDANAQSCPSPDHQYRIELKFRDCAREGGLDSSATDRLLQYLGSLWNVDRVDLLAAIQGPISTAQLPASAPVGGETK